MRLNWRAPVGVALAPLSRWLTRGVPRTLFYHRFGNFGPRLMEPAVFEAQLVYLKEHFNLVSLQDICHAAQLGSWRSLPVHALAVTIDDAYADFGKIAYPLLLKHRIPTTLFVVSDFALGRTWLWFDRLRFICEASPLESLHLKALDAQIKLDLNAAIPGAVNKAWSMLADHCLTLNPTDREEFIHFVAQCAQVLVPVKPPAQYRGMSIEQLKALDSSLIEIGAHTKTHPILKHCTPFELMAEIKGSKSDLEKHLDRPVPLFCYPNGRLLDFDAEVEQQVREAGFIGAVTSEPYPSQEGSPYLLARLGAPHDLDSFKREVDGLSHLQRQVAGSLAWRKRVTDKSS